MRDRFGEPIACLLEALGARAAPTNSETSSSIISAATGPDRLANHAGVLVEQHLPDNLLDRHPVGTGHTAPAFIVESREARRTISAASAGTTIRPTATYTTLCDATGGGAIRTLGRGIAPRP